MVEKKNAQAKVGMTWEGNDIYYPQASGAQKWESQWKGLSFSQGCAQKRQSHIIGRH